MRGDGYISSMRTVINMLCLLKMELPVVVVVLRNLE